MNELDFGVLSGMLGLELRKAQQIAEQTFANFVSGSLLPGHLTILVLIKDNPNQSQSAIAKAAGLDRSSLVPIVKQFEKRDWIVRQKSSVDSRANIVNITDEGLNQLNEYLPLTQTLESKVKNEMSVKDYDALVSLLKKFQNSVINIVTQ